MNEVLVKYDLVAREALKHVTSIVHLKKKCAEIIEQGGTPSTTIKALNKAFSKIYDVLMDSMSLLVSPTLFKGLSKRGQEYATWMRQCSNDDDKDKFETYIYENLFRIVSPLEYTMNRNNVEKAAALIIDKSYKDDQLKLYETTAYILLGQFIQSINWVENYHYLFNTLQKDFMIALDYATDIEKDELNDNLNELKLISNTSSVTYEDIKVLVNEIETTAKLFDDEGQELESLDMNKFEFIILSLMDIIREIGNTKFE